MNANSYVDNTAILHVIGCVLKDPTILDITDKYIIRADDFIEEFHKIVFGSIQNIFLTGSSVTINAILDYLSNRPQYFAVFKQYNGTEYLQKVLDVANLETFNYYYNRMKKMTLLRMYTKIGVDVTDLYDPTNVLDVQKRQQQEDWLDNNSLQSIGAAIDLKIDGIKEKYIENIDGNSQQAADGMLELIEDLQKNPEVGIPLYGRLINTVTRGARLSKLYLRSSKTGLGKTRMLAADACYFAVQKLYTDEFGWVSNGLSHPTLFIATEQNFQEVQTLFLAFVSNVNEDHILKGKYEEGELERVKEAARVIEAANLWIECLPDYSIEDLENTIKRNIREHNIKYVCFDYIFTSMKLLSEIVTKSGGIKLREDNVLFMLAVHLKELCNKYGIFIITSTQLNSQYQDSETPNQNLLRGAKAMADKIDVGLIALDATPEDLKKLEPILKTGMFKNPDIKLSIYKNRRGRYKDIFLWCEADLGTCRVNPLFATKYNYDIIPIEETKIIIEEEEKPAWEED